MQFDGVQVPQLYYWSCSCGHRARQMTTQRAVSYRAAREHYYKYKDHHKLSIHEVVVDSLHPFSKTV